MNKNQQKMAALAEVAELYGATISPAAVGLWDAALEPYEVEQVRKAFAAHMRDPDGGRFMPKPAHLMRFLEGNATVLAALAWGKALEAAGSVGANTDVVFDDPAKHATIEDLGGWPKFCRTETAELSYLQHRFTQSYQAYAHKCDFTYSRRLNGDRSPDDVCTARGLPPPKPALIGDSGKAKEVYRLGSTGGKTAITHVSAAVLANPAANALQRVERKAA